MQAGGGAWQARQVRRLCHLWPACQVAFGGGHLAAAGLGGQLWVWDTAVAGADAIPEEHLQLQAGPPFVVPNIPFTVLWCQTSLWCTLRCMQLPMHLQP